MLNGYGFELSLVGYWRSKRRLIIWGARIAKGKKDEAKNYISEN